jgi:hypothetical protein
VYFGEQQVCVNCRRDTNGWPGLTGTKSTVRSFHLSVTGLSSKGELPPKTQENFHYQNLVQSHFQTLRINDWFHFLTSVNLRCARNIKIFSFPTKYSKRLFCQSLYRLYIEYKVCAEVQVQEEQLHIYLVWKYLSP